MSDGEYGFMPEWPCDECGGRWPTRYQYSISVFGPDGWVEVMLCSICFAQTFEVGVRQFNLRYTGKNSVHGRRLNIPLKVKGPTERGSGESGG